LVKQMTSKKVVFHFMLTPRVHLPLLLQAQPITVYRYQQTVTQPDVPPAFVAKLFSNLGQDQSQPVQLHFTVDGQHSTPTAAAAGARLHASHAKLGRGCTVASAAAAPRHSIDVHLHTYILLMYLGMHECSADEALMRNDMATTAAVCMKGCSVWVQRGAFNMCQLKQHCGMHFFATNVTHRGCCVCI
jgi:hypothetical protein